MFRSIFLICSILSLGGCSNVNVSTNLDKENFDLYFTPSTVTVYQQNELQEIEYKILAAVEGSSCQIAMNDRPADIKQARTNARIKAAALHANGIVIQSCLRFPADDSCISNIICYGRALNVISDDK